GNSYEVEVEEVRNGVQQAAPAVAHVPTPAPTPAPAVPTPSPSPSPAPAPAPANKEVVISAGQEVIEAPMPGTILKINVSEGQSIKSGDVLLILEAMKMENEIISPVDGKVVGIATSVGASVNAGDKLV